MNSKYPNYLKSNNNPRPLPMPFSPVTEAARKKPVVDNERLFNSNPNPIPTGPGPGPGSTPLLMSKDWAESVKLATAMKMHMHKPRMEMEMVKSKPLEYCGSKRPLSVVSCGRNGHKLDPSVPPLAKRLKEREAEAKASQPQQHDDDDEHSRDMEQLDMDQGVFAELSPNASFSSWQDSEESGSSADSVAVQRNRVGKREKVYDSWIVKGKMPGGPIDGSVIPSFGGHIARRIWGGHDDPMVLKCANRSWACKILQTWREELSIDTKARVDATKLAHLPWAMFSDIDDALISAFVERWQPDTNSFHMPFGEMTIMLHDVVQILRIPVDGQMVSAQTSLEDLRYTAAELLKMDPSNLCDGSVHWIRSAVPDTSINDLCRKRVPRRSDDAQLTAYLFLLLGCTLFVDKSDSGVRPHDIVEAMDDPDSIGGYSWGSATLAYLYRQLGIASRTDCRGVGGCLTLLQAWIYEYFPAFRPHKERKTIQSGYPRSCMWDVQCKDKDTEKNRLCSIRRQLDKMTASEVEWLPYGPEPFEEVPRTLQVRGYVQYRDIIEPYMSDRVVRQLGYMQEIPLEILTPTYAVRSENSAEYDSRHDVKHAEWIWRAFPKVNRLYLSGLTSCSDLSACDPSYLPWFCQHSHPRLVRNKESEKPLNRTLVDDWMEMAIRATEPFLKARDRMPNKETRAACVEWDRIIRLWNAAPDSSKPTQTTKK